MLSHVVCVCRGIYSWWGVILAPLLEGGAVHLQATGSSFSLVLLAASFSTLFLRVVASMQAVIFCRFYLFYLQRQNYVVLYERECEWVAEDAWSPDLSIHWPYILLYFHFAYKVSLKWTHSTDSHGCAIRVSIIALHSFTDFCSKDGRFTLQTIGFSGKTQCCRL